MSDTVVDRVKKLLARTTEANCTQAEADSAFEMATRLIAKHNLDMTRVTAKPADESFVELEAFRTGRWSLQHNMAFNIASEFCFVKGLFTYTPGNYRRHKILLLFGTQTNVESARYMFLALVEAMDNLFQHYRIRTGHAATEKRSFTEGVAAGFSAKMRQGQQKLALEQDEAEHIQSGGTALALRNITEQTAVAYKKRHPNLKTSHTNFGGQTGSSSSYNEGYRQGQNLNLRKKLT